MAGARDNNTVISMKYGAVKSTTDSRFSEGWRKYELYVIDGLIDGVID